MNRSHVPTLGGVLEMIPKLIDSATDVGEYTEQYAAVRQRLQRLKDKLNGSTDRLQHELGKRVFDKLIHRLYRTLTILSKLIYQCQNPNKGLKGLEKLRMDQALKRELDEIKFSLVNDEATMTIDLRERNEILYSALHEKQVTDKSRQEVQIAERTAMLSKIQTEAKINAEEKLPKLHEKHKDIIVCYLDQCEHSHTGIQIVGLEGSIDDFRCKIYKLPALPISPAIFTQIRTVELPVESVYIHLKADHTTTFEREQAQKLILKDKDDNERESDAYDRELHMELASVPTMESFIERERVDKKQESDKSSFQDMLRNNRWIVVLGDPGSGKTTFVRWLVSKSIGKVRGHMKTMCNDRIANAGDDDKDKNAHGSDESFLDGPIRIPILIRVGEFAEALSSNSDLSLFNYIGFHTWMGNPMLDFTSTPEETEQTNRKEQLQKALHDYINEGYALIILDGLDEISTIEARKKIVRLVEGFVQEYVQTPSYVSNVDNHFFNKELDIPSEAGGNQLIITSRIAGYHAQPLSGHFSHHTILSMEIDDMKKFVDHWFQTIHKKMISLLKLNIRDEEMQIACENQTALLKVQLEKPNNQGLRQMASNPCLMNFICRIAFQKGGAELPTKRILLYDEIAKLMRKLWASREASGILAKDNDCDRLLRAIANYIHKKCSSGLIEKTNLKLVCKEWLETLTKSQTEAEREKMATDCINDFQKIAGILAERGQNMFGFLHLTLQEYYTCKSIVDIERTSAEDSEGKSIQEIEKQNNRPQKLVQIFQEHITDPRYRVPLILALGWVSSKWEQLEFDHFCQILFTSKNHLSTYFPLEILMFITSRDELTKMPSDDKIFTAFDSLLSVSSTRNWHQSYPDLERRIAVGLLKQSKTIIENWILHVLSEKPSIQLVSTLCTLLRECERVAKADEGMENRLLMKEWVTEKIYKLLSQYLPHDTIENQFLIDVVLSKVAITNWQALPANNLRRFFNENPSCLTKLNLPILASIIALCGGLTLSNRDKKTNQKRSFDYDGDMVTSIDFIVTFLPKNMHRESPLESLLIDNIRIDQKNNASDAHVDFMNQIEKHAKKISPNDCSLEAVDTFILMFCAMGVDRIWLLEHFVHHKAFHLAINRFKRISNYLRQFYFIPEIYDRFEKSICSNDSLLSNFDNFDKWMYNNCTINRDSTQLIDLFMNWYQLVEKGRSLESSSEQLETLFVFIDSICRGRARLCTSTRTSLTNKWCCKTDQRFLLLPKFFEKEENRKQLLHCTSTHSSMSNISLPMFLRTLWTFDDEHHGADISEVTIHKGECSMLLEYDKHHSFALTFVPKHLLLLFSHAITEGYIVVTSYDGKQVVTKDHVHTLSFTHVLCTSLLSVCRIPAAYACQSALVALLPLARIYRLEYMVLALLYWTNEMSNYDPNAVKWYFEEMKRPMDSKRFSYTDGHNKLTEVDRVEISDAEVQRGLQLAMDEVKRCLYDALEKQKSSKSEKNVNGDIFVASVSLAYLCWSSSSENRQSLFEKSIEAVTTITDSMIRLNALNILALCPFLRSYKESFADCTKLQTRLYDLVMTTFSELPSDLTTMFLVLSIDRHISLVGANENTIQKILHVLDRIDNLSDEDEKRAICVALGPCISLSPGLSPRLNRCLQKFEKSPVLARAQVLQFDSSLLLHFAQDFTKQKSSSHRILRNKDQFQSISTLCACIYLANLSSDVQKLSNWLGNRQLIEDDTSRLLNETTDRSQKQRILTNSHILAIRKKLDSLNDASLVAREITILETELHNFHQCEFSARRLIAEWLNYQQEHPRYALTCHAALILGRSGVWTVAIANILCDLLLNENDRFRHEAECLLNESERKSSELGWEVLFSFIERFVSYVTKSTYASQVLSDLFEKLTIDNREHLDNIILLEIIGTGVQRKSSNNTNGSKSEVQDNLLNNCCWIVSWFIRFAPDVMEHFTNHLKLFIDHLPGQSNRNTYKLTYAGIFAWCAKISAIDSNSIEKMQQLLSNKLTENIPSNIQCSAAFVIGHSNTQKAQEILLTIIQNDSKKSNTIDEKTLVMCIRAYCFSCTFNKPKSTNQNQHDNEKGNDKSKNDENVKKIESLCCQMLKHSSRHVQDAASIELAKVCPNVEKLLEFIEKDHRRCYQSLSRVNIDRSDTEAWKQHSKRMIELIKASPALLKIYINELYESIKNFTEQLEPYPEQSDQFDELFLIPIACELVEEMPSAFFVELDEMSYKENLQKALLCTSKQHDYRQRNACIKLLSTLGEFTVEICELLIDGLIESPTTQAACLDSIKYFRKPNGLTQRDMAVQQVDHVIKQFESTREPLPSQLHKLRSALLELESAGKFLEEVLSELESRQAPLKSAEKELKPILIHLKPILEQWEPAVLQLAKHLRSPSLNKRWGTALLFERLVQCNVISARRVQHLLTDTIEDSHSNNKLWLHQDNTSQSSYICVGNLNHMLCKLLMRMSSIEETSTEVKVYEIRNRLLEDFDVAETSARFASCVNLDEDSLDECESELEHSKPVEKQVKPTEIRPESANKSTKQTESHQRPSSHRKESARAEQRPKSSQESIPESSICNIL